MPFDIAARLLSKVLFFVPNAYVILLGILQAALLLFCFSVLARLLRLEGAKKALFLALVTVSYPTMLFLLTVEQYIFSLIWVLLLVEAYCEDAPNREFKWVAATGSLLTRGALVFLLPYKKSFRSILIELLKAGGLLLAFSRRSGGFRCSTARPPRFGN
jgi:predicted neutral ceramidase superfamily lipid hydrolase